MIVELAGALCEPEAVEKGDFMPTEVMGMIAVVIVAGALGGFVNVFIGDSGLHLPKFENDTFLPGYLGTVLIGALAALGSWGSAKAIVIFGGDAKAAAAVTFTTADIANALMIGFGGAKWFKSEGEKDILQRTAGIAAGKPSDPTAAATIGNSTPMKALAAAINMKP